MHLLWIFQGKLSQKLKTGFRGSVNLNKYIIELNDKINNAGSFNFIVDPNSEKINEFSVLGFPKAADQIINGIKGCR